MKLDFPVVMESIVFILLLVITIFGITSVPPDFEVNAEYINGVLTASSILFGFWIVIIEKKPKEETKKFMYENAIYFAFFVSFVFLLISVTLLYFSALDKLSSVYTLLFSTLSFLLNAFSVAVTLYYYKFKR